MGCRVHVVKKQRDYGSSEAFNYKIDEFSTLLSRLGCEICAQDDCYNFFEVDVEEYKRAIEVLKLFIKSSGDKEFDMLTRKKYPRKTYLEIAEYEDIEDAIERLEDYKAEDVLAVMQAFYRERDKKSGWVQFEMW